MESVLASPANKNSLPLSAAQSDRAYLTRTMSRCNTPTKDARSLMPCIAKVNYEWKLYSDRNWHTAAKLTREVNACSSREPFALRLP